VVENRVIPHLEALICGCLEAEGWGCGSPFTFYLMKKGVLYEKHAFVRFDLKITVNILENNYKIIRQN